MGSSAYITLGVGDGKRARVLKRIRCHLGIRLSESEGSDESEKEMRKSLDLGPQCRDAPRSPGAGTCSGGFGWPVGRSLWSCNSNLEDAHHDK